MTSPAVIALLEAVPELAPRYLELVAACDDDPGLAPTLTELADVVASALDAAPPATDVVRRAADALEAVLAGPAGGDVADEVVGAFFEELSPADARRLRPYLGRTTRRMLATDA